MDSNDRSELGPDGRLARHEISFITILSLTEIGVGSIVHALHIPLGGHLLSINQGFVLLQATKKLEGPADRIAAARSASNISLVTALMKSFSPAGKKLTPMLAITAQGLLFSAGIILGGTGVLGAILGMLLLSFWGFAQPILIAWIFVGGNFWEALENLWQKMATPLGIQSVNAWEMILLFIAIKAVLVMSLAFVSSQRADRWSAKLLLRGELALKNKSPRTKPRQILKGLLSPLVLFSIFLSVTFAYSTNAVGIALLWASLRPIAAALVAIFLLRTLSSETLIKIFARNNSHRAQLIRSVKQSLEHFTR